MESKWYSVRCINYGKYPDTEFYRMCQRCRANKYQGPCEQFKMKRTKKNTQVKENENDI